MSSHSVARRRMTHSRNDHGVTKHPVVVMAHRPPSTVVGRRGGRSFLIMIGSIATLMVWMIGLQLRMQTRNSNSVHIVEHPPYSSLDTVVAAGPSVHHGDDSRRKIVLVVLDSLNELSQEDSRARRQVIRETYLKFYEQVPSLGKSSLICSFLNRSNGDKMKHDSCRIYYTFVSTNGNQTILEDDVLAVSSSQGPSSRAIHLVIQALQSRLQAFESAYPHSLILWTDADTYFFPPVVLDAVDSMDIRLRPSRLELMGGTPFVDVTQCFRNKTYTAQHSDHCTHPSGKGFFVPISTVTTQRRLPGRTMEEVREWAKASTKSNVFVPLAPWPRMGRNSKLYARQWQQDIQSSILLPLKASQAAWKASGLDAAASLTMITAKLGPSQKFSWQVADRRSSLVLSSGLSNVARQVYSYDGLPSAIASDPKWSSHVQALEAGARGGGHWFFKAPLILQHLQQSPFLFYNDLDYEWKPQIPMVLQKMVDTGADLALHPSAHLERQYTKGDAYFEICGPEQNINSDNTLQYTAGWLLLRVNSRTIRLIQEWAGWKSNYSLLNDSPSSHPNAPDFIEHRHDQSLLSLVLKCGRSARAVQVAAMDLEDSFAVSLLRLSD